MKVLFTFGGLPHYYNHILNKLNDAANLDIAVIVPKWNGKTIGEGVHQTYKNANFEIIEAKEYKTFYGKFFFKNISRIIDEQNPEIIVLIWPYVLALIFNLKFIYKVKKNKIKIILKDIPFGVPKFIDALRFKPYLFRHEKLKQTDTYLKRINVFLLSFLRKIYLNFIDAHVNYIEEAFEILGSYGVPKEKIFIIYNSPNTDVLFKVKKEIINSDPILPPNYYRIIHVGRLVKWKKVDLLIKAVSKLKDRHNDIELIVIGDGPEKINLENLAGKLKLENSIKFVGAIHDPFILGHYLTASSIYVLAGMGGLSINEAMAFGKPIICSVCDGTERKLVRDGFNGKYFDEDSINDLVEKIDFILSDKKRLEKMGENSYSIIKNEVNLDTVVRGYIKAFNYVNKYGLYYIK